MTCLSPEPGESLDQAVDRWRADGTLPAETADEVVEFAAFLRTTAELGLAVGEPLPPNVMRRFRVLLGVTHAEIDEYEQKLQLTEEPGPTIRNVPRSIARPSDGPVHDGGPW